MSFYIWLISQSDRDDSVGSLANDVLKKDGSEIMLHYASRKSWAAYLSTWASDDARRALDGAMDEFDDSRT